MGGFCLHTHSVVTNTCSSQDHETKLKAGVIEKVDASPWVLPIVGGIKLCADLRESNKTVITDCYPLPQMEEIFANLQGAEMFFTTDHETFQRMVVRQRCPPSLLLAMSENSPLLCWHLMLLIKRHSASSYWELKNVHTEECKASLLSWTGVFCCFLSNVFSSVPSFKLNELIEEESETTDLKSESMMCTLVISHAFSFWSFASSVSESKDLEKTKSIGE